MSTYINSCKNPSATIPCRFSDSLQLRIQENRHILKRIVQAVLFCGWQCVAFRGDGEHQDSGNPGNFIAFLRQLAQADPLLEQHLSAPQRKNSTYMSTMSQSDIINIIGFKQLGKAF
ncbi:zinc finger MYM-type protein 1-like [Anneissia japonica]|uniref:zinc finger MYM-type protein 1-like n=1 Tax=Anneissia japonica TaxID=1529436 RepID=UPI00142596BD|nr:zinc finger MYM-type protein 1-like [Anneissia japonica]